ncbi:hypothetical protein RSO01_90820 [Reyranella soli]|uniref:Uncharacterized protein n=2 Tax=Reyranella soli TaxID=1230389 RepID=A0A512NSI9_9HYPH|nr:hypothetical protein RSO01_90820 [Reyranella soli]
MARVGRLGGGKMFVEISSDGQISAVYVEQQYPDQKWVPPSNEALQAFLGDAPKLGRDAKGRTCLLPAPILPLPKPRPLKGPKAQMKQPSRVCGQSSPEKVDHSMAMRFTSALYEYTQHEPMPWKWLGDIAKHAGIQRDDQFKRAFEVAEAAGWLIVHDGNAVKLTFAGMRAVRRFQDSAMEKPWDVAALPAQPPLASSSTQLGMGT